MKNRHMIERIRKRCQQQQWYGGDISNTARYTRWDRRYEIVYTADGESFMRDKNPDDHPRKTSFAYPPATRDQLLLTEQALGFPLPPLLWDLYTQLANGGFGPGYGLHGALGGFNEAGNLVDGYMFHLKHSHLIDLEASTRSSLLAQEALDLPETVWPRSLLYLCDWGCATTSCLDAASGCISLCRPSSTSHRTYTLRLEAPSLEAWFELWLEDNLQEKGQPVEDLTGPDDVSDGAVVPFYLSEDPFESDDEER